MTKPIVSCTACGKSFAVPNSFITRFTHHFCCAACKRTPCIPRECANCQKTFLATGGNWSTIMFCSRECKNARNSKIELHKRYLYAEKSCEHCGSTFRLNKSYINVQRFCSRVCATASGSNVSKGEQHSRWVPKPQYTCAHCQKVFFGEAQRPRQRKAVFCSKECGVAFREASKITKVCEQCGTQFKVKPWRANRSRFCSIPCKGAWVCANTQSPTSIEIAISNLLNQMSIEHETQKAIGPFNCDIYIVSCNLVIEVDGDYWHSLPKHKQQDKRRNTYLLNRNYRILRLPEHKIRKDLTWCKKQILKAMKPGAWQSPLL